MSLKKIAREHLYIKPMGYAKAQEIVAGVDRRENSNTAQRVKALELMVAYGIHPMLAQRMIGVKPHTAIYPRVRDLCEQLVDVESDFKPSPVMTEKQFEFYCSVAESEGYEASDECRNSAMLYLVYGEDDMNIIHVLYSEPFMDYCSVLMDIKKRGL